jgi:hypothetical protein
MTTFSREIANGYTLRIRHEDRAGRDLGTWELVSPYGVCVLGSVRFNSEAEAMRRAMVELARCDY